MPELLLDEFHQYRLDERPIDGLTSTIAEAGLIRGGDPWYMTRGSAIHLATEYFDKGTLDEDSVSDEIKGYLASWKQFRVDQNYTPTHIELKLYDPIYLYAGTLDRLPLLDLKSGAFAKWHRIQLAGYWGLCRINNLTDHCQNPISVYLEEDGRSPKVIQYTQQDMRKSLQDFLCLLSANRIKRELLK